MQCKCPKNNKGKESTKQKEGGTKLEESTEFEGNIERVMEAIHANTKSAISHRTNGKIDPGALPRYSEISWQFSTLQDGKAEQIIINHRKKMPKTKGNSNSLSASTDPRFQAFPGVPIWKKKSPPFM